MVAAAIFTEDRAEQVQINGLVLMFPLTSHQDMLLKEQNCIRHDRQGKKTK